MNTHFVDLLSLKLVIFSGFMILLSLALKHIRRTGEIAHLASIQPVLSRASGSDKIFAKLPFITSSDGVCPLLRSILVDDLGCREITEVTGGGDAWWDFTFKGKRFSCRLLPKSSHGSELTRVSAADNSEDNDPLLQLLAHKIAWHSAIKTGLTCHSLLCL